MLQKSSANPTWFQFIVTGLLLSGVSGLAQDPPPRMSRPGAPPTRRMPTPEKTPCWQKAGVSQEVMSRVTGIRDNTRTQVSTVCADASLSREQKLDQIAQVRKAAHDQVDALIPKGQQEVIRSCQAARTRRPRRHRGPHKTPDPCGYVTPGDPATNPTINPEDSNQAVPADAAPAPDKAVPDKNAAPGKETDPSKAPGKNAESDPATKKSATAKN
jgi:hypothetical protein